MVFGIQEGDTGIFRVRCLSKSCAKVSMERIVGHELHHPGLTGLQKVKSQDPHMGVSKNRGTPKSSILIGFSITNHPFWVPLFSETSTSEFWSFTKIMSNWWEIWHQKTWGKIEHLSSSSASSSERLPPKKRLQNIEERKNTVFSPTSLQMPKKNYQFFVTFFGMMKTVIPSKVGTVKTPTVGDKVWVTSPELSELGEDLLNGGSGFFGTSPVGVFTYLP